MKLLETTTTSGSSINPTGPDGIKVIEIRLPPTCMHTKIYTPLFY